VKSHHWRVAPLAAGLVSEEGGCAAPPRCGPGEGEVRGVGFGGAVSPHRGPGEGEVGGVSVRGAAPLRREVGGCRCRRRLPDGTWRPGRGFERLEPSPADNGGGDFSGGRFTPAAL
jgi:hypothetical protein